MSSSMEFLALLGTAGPGDGGCSPPMLDMGSVGRKAELKMIESVRVRDLSVDDCLY